MARRHTPVSHPIIRSVIWLVDRNVICMNNQLFQVGQAGMGNWDRCRMCICVVDGKVRLKVGVGDKGIYKMKLQTC